MLTVHTNPSRKQCVFENAPQTGRIWKRLLFVFVLTKNILKTKLFENDDVTTIMWFSWPSFPQTQILNDRWLSRFQISPAQCGRRTLVHFENASLNFSRVVWTGRKSCQWFFAEISLLERLMTSCTAYARGRRGNYNSDLLTKLVNNYRSHKAIIEIPKQLFYDNELNECARDFR